MALSALVMAALLSGCVSGRKLELNYSPEPRAIPGLSSTTFDVVVNDQRSYVTSGDKKAWYLGHFRFVFGNPINVYTRDELPLSVHLKNDLRRELSSLGLVEAKSAPSRQVAVVIHDWNFDAGVEGRFWYEVKITVSDVQGQSLATMRLTDSKLIEGNLKETSKWKLEEQIPAFYGEFIRKLVRENPPILEALRVAGS